MRARGDSDRIVDRPCAAEPAALLPLLGERVENGSCTFASLVLMLDSTGFLGSRAASRRTSVEILDQYQVQQCVRQGIEVSSRKMRC